METCLHIKICGHGSSIDPSWLRDREPAAQEKLGLWNQTSQLAAAGLGLEPR